MFEKLNGFSKGIGSRAIDTISQGVLRAMVKELGGNEKEGQTEGLIVQIKACIRRIYRESVITEKTIESLYRFCPAEGSKDFHSKVDILIAHLEREIEIMSGDKKYENSVKEIQQMIDYLNDLQASYPVSKSIAVIDIQSKRRTLRV
jgi:hypothetical protein